MDFRQARSAAGRTCRIGEAHGCQTAVSVVLVFRRGTLGFKRCSLHRTDRVSAGLRLSGFRRNPPFQPCCFPPCLSTVGWSPYEVKLVTQRYHAQPFPCCTGINSAATRRTNPQELTDCASARPDSASRSDTERDSNRRQAFSLFQPKSNPQNAFGISTRATL